MALIHSVTRTIFSCFRAMERCMDRATGRAGFVFVTLAVVLLSMSTFTYFEVIFQLSFVRAGRHPLVVLWSLTISVYLATCTVIHYYLACATPAGSPSGLSLDPKASRMGQATCLVGARRWVMRLNRSHSEHPDRKPTSPPQRGFTRCCVKCLKNGIQGVNGKGPLKPERAHHCRVCGRCQLKYDHHCPWINQCVGLGNERYFILFLFYLSISCAWVVGWGWTALLESVEFDNDWPFWSPRICVILTWILALALGLTVSVIWAWQMMLIIKSETAVEAEDNVYYQKLFASRGEVFKNPYDLGAKANLELFFNIGPGRFPWFTVFLPIPIPPPVDGWRWPKRVGWEAQSIDLAEELTDIEE